MGAGLGYTGAMIDLHCHILPGVDDGARDFDDSLALARGLVAAGFRAVAPSPHHGGGAGGDVSRIRATEVRAQLAGRLAADGVELELLPNAEHCLTPSLLERIHEDRELIETVGGKGRWLLVELPWEGVPKIPEQIFRIQTKGYRVVLAHPERYRFLEADDARALVERGVLLQLELGSLVGVYGDRAKARAENLLSSGHVHIVATDTHRPEQCAWLEDGMTALRKRVGDEGFDTLLSANPKRLIADEEWDAILAVGS